MTTKSLPIADPHYAHYAHYARMYNGYNAPMGAKENSP